jgi:hypothetical protein
VFVVTDRRVPARRCSSLSASHSLAAVQVAVASLADLDRLYETVKRERCVVHTVVANAGIGDHRTHAH